MFKLNLHLSQIAALELFDVEYKLHERNPDGITFTVEFANEKDYAKALEILIRS